MKALLLEFLFIAALSVGQSFCFHPASLPPEFRPQVHSVTRRCPHCRIKGVVRCSNGDMQEDHKSENLSYDEETRKQKKSQAKINVEEERREQRKSQVAKAAAQIMKISEVEEKTSFLDKLNPFYAGKSLRKSLDSAITSLARVNSPGALSENRRGSLYYLDDRFRESGGALFTQESNPYLTQLEKDEYIPEVLIVGAKGEVGRLVVKRLLLEGRSRVRVLVPDLYSKTLNMLGTGVVYYQGDLNNMDSLETALTDVDKIVHINSAPRPDEDAFQSKFLGFAEDNLRGSTELGKIKSSLSFADSTNKDATAADLEWERLEAVLKVRASLAREIDFLGMQNLVRAYQNVRFADYGTGQAAKRSLFKFQREEDFNFFMIDDDRETQSLQTRSLCDEGGNEDKKRSLADGMPRPRSTQIPRQSDLYASGDDVFNEYADEDADRYEEYADAYDKYEDNVFAGASLLSPAREQRRDTTVKTQVQWIHNEFGSGVFVGKVPQSTSRGIGGEAAITSGRLRTRDGGPEDGIDLSVGFGGFVCRVCADGGVYEGFVRDASFERNGIEFVCEFSTSSKSPQGGNASRNKFSTVRLPFASFKPVRRRCIGKVLEDAMPSFTGRDVRYLGFRYRSSRNTSLNAKAQASQMSSFYMAFSYIKLYRIQPEPEFVYLSDARIPPVVSDAQLRHNLHQLVPKEALPSSKPSNNGAFQILDDNALQKMSSDEMARSPEETYYKYRGEEVLKSSGLSYAIIRVAGYNEAPSSEASTIHLTSTEEGVKPVSRAEVAQVCVSALLDPNALNKSFYVSNNDSSPSTFNETISAKFSALHKDPVKH